MWESSLEDFMEQLAAPSPTPSGGSAASVTVAMGAALALMCLRISAKKQASAKCEHDIAELNDLVSEVKADGENDIKAVRALIDAMHLPRTTAGEKAARDIVKAAAAHHATEAPLALAQHAAEVLDICLRSRGIVTPAVQGDLDAAIALLRGAVTAVLETAAANFSLLGEADRIELSRRHEMLTAQMATFLAN